MNTPLDDLRGSLDQMIHYLTGIRDEINAGTYTQETAAADVFHLENEGLDWFSALTYYAEHSEDTAQ